MPKKGLFGGFGTQRVRAEPKAEPASTSPLKSLFGGKACPRAARLSSDAELGCQARSVTCPMLVVYHRGLLLSWRSEKML